MFLVFLRKKKEKKLPNEYEPLFISKGLWPFNKREEKNMALKLWKNWKNQRFTVKTEKEGEKKINNCSI